MASLESECRSLNDSSAACCLVELGQVHYLLQASVSLSVKPGQEQSLPHWVVVKLGEAAFGRCLCCVISVWPTEWPCPLEESPLGGGELVPSLFESRQGREVSFGMGGEWLLDTPLGNLEAGQLWSEAPRSPLVAPLLLFNNFHVLLLVLAPGSRALPQELP